MIQSKLVDLLRWVSNSNGFYKDMITSKPIRNPLEIIEYPIITRSMLNDDTYKLLSNSYLQEFYSQNLICKHTSGSSGEPLFIYWDKNGYYASMVELWSLRKKWYQIEPKDKMLTFSLLTFGEKNTNHVQYSINGNIMSMSKNNIFEEAVLKEIIQIVNQFRPKWIYAQPFVLSLLLKTYKSSKCTLPNETIYIESYGEVLTQDLKNELKSYFGIKVANMYGCEEANAIAFECPNGNMHVLKNNVYVECIDNEQIKKYGSGPIIITSLTNHAIPLIRYQLGDDVSIVGDDNCECGEKGQIIKRINGRTRNTINFGSNCLSEYVLSEIIDEVNNEFNYSISWYRYYISTNVIINLKIVIDQSKKKWKESMCKRIREVFQHKIDNQMISLNEIIVVDNVPQNTIKHRIVEYT